MLDPNPWIDLGLAWASAQTPAGQVLVARSLQKWEVLSPPSREALRRYVCTLAPPPPELATELGAAGLIHLDDDRPDRPALIYPGTGLIALDRQRKNLTPLLSEALLGWYRRSYFRLPRTFHLFVAERPSGAHETFAELERARLVERREKRLYRSTLRVWAVARLVEEAAIFVDEDGPTRPRMAARVEATP